MISLGFNFPKDIIITLKSLNIIAASTLCCVSIPSPPIFLLYSQHHSYTVLILFPRLLLLSLSSEVIVTTTFCLLRNFLCYPVTLFIHYHHNYSFITASQTCFFLSPRTGAKLLSLSPFVLHRDSSFCYISFILQIVCINSSVIYFPRLSLLLF